MNAAIDDLFGPIIYELQQHNNNDHAVNLPHSAQPLTIPEYEPEAIAATGQPATKKAATSDLIDLTGDDSDTNVSEPDVSHDNSNLFMVVPQSASKKRKRDLMDNIEKLLEDEEPGSDILKELQQRALLCPICHDAVQKPTSTLCGHIFCATCIHNWVSKKHNCPSCQIAMEVEHMHPIYL